MSLLPDTRNCGLRMRRECRERFPHHCVTHVPWCMPGSLNNGFRLSRWRGRRSRHSWRMRNLQFCVSGKRPIAKVSGCAPYKWKVRDVEKEAGDILNSAYTQRYFCSVYHITRYILNVSNCNVDYFWYHIISICGYSSIICMWFHAY